MFVGAETDLFKPAQGNNPSSNREEPFTVLFYGQFIPLHGLSTIVHAAKILEDKGKEIRWRIVGRGQEEQAIDRLIGESGIRSIERISWIPYGQLNEWLQKADVCLGIFGKSGKAMRVIPNKVFQGLAAGRPVITADTPPVRELFSEQDGVHFVPPDTPSALADMVQKMADGFEGDADSGRPRPRIGPDDVGGQFQELVSDFFSQRPSRAVPDSVSPSSGFFSSVCLISLLTGAFVMLAWMAYRVFNNHPFSDDEYGYFYQAVLFSKGWTHYLVTGLPDALNKEYKKIRLMYFTGEIEALIALFLVATNTYFLGYGASYFSQPAALLMTSLSYVLFYHWRNRRADWILVALGFSLAYGMITRPLDGFCVLVPVGVSLLCAQKRRRIKTMALWGVPIIVVLFLFFSYNQYLSGRFSISTYPILDSEFKLIHADAISLSDNVRMLAESYLSSLKDHAWPLLRYAFIGHMGMALPALAALAFVRRSAFFWPIFFLSHLMLIIALYNFHHSYGWPQYGARYYYPLLADIVPLAAFGIQTLRDRCFRGDFSRRRWVRYGGVFLLVFVVATQLSDHKRRLNEYARRFQFVERTKRHIEQTCADYSIVVLDPRIWDYSKVPKFVNMTDFQRNMFRDDHRWVVLGDLNCKAVQDVFPRMPLCFYDFKEEMR